MSYYDLLIALINAEKWLREAKNLTKDVNMKMELDEMANRVGRMAVEVNTKLVGL